MESNSPGTLPALDAQSLSNSSKLLELLNNRTNGKLNFFSIEISPTGEDEPLDFDCFGNNQPLFTSITWLGDSNLNHHPIKTAPALQLTKSISKLNPVVLHITCYKLDRPYLEEILNSDIQSVFALKGDAECETQQWRYAVNLVRTIRSIRPNITIGVAGYPETHRLASNIGYDLTYLKMKIDAGSDFIITNICFSYNHLIDFIKICQQQGVSVPILAGVYIPSSYSDLIKMSRKCKFSIPDSLLRILRQHRDNDCAFQAIAIDNAVSLIKRLFEANIYGIHYFTLNKYKLIHKVLAKLKMLK